jgi:hypothetical protein
MTFNYLNLPIGDPIIPGPEDGNGMPEKSVDDETINCMIDGLIEEISLMDEPSMTNLSTACLQRIAAVERAACGKVSDRVQRLCDERHPKP